MRLAAGMSCASLLARIMTPGGSGGRQGQMKCEVQGGMGKALKRA